MAKLSAHGATIGIIELMVSRRRYMSDGVILENKGAGWKRWGKIKPGNTPQIAFANASEAQSTYQRERPCYAAYCKALADICASLENRRLIHLAISMMPDDCDGVWSELQDNRLLTDASVDEIGEICRTYSAMCAELKRIDAEKLQKHEARQ